MPIIPAILFSHSQIKKYRYACFNGSFIRKRIYFSVSPCLTCTNQLQWIALNNPFDKKRILNTNKSRKAKKREREKRKFNPLTFQLVSTACAGHQRGRFENRLVVQKFWSHFFAFEFKKIYTIIYIINFFNLLITYCFYYVIHKP